MRLLAFEVFLIWHRGSRSGLVRQRVDGFGGLVLSFSCTPLRRRGIWMEKDTVVLLEVDIVPMGDIMERLVVPC